jgi:hypothetical protein
VPPFPKFRSIEKDSGIYFELDTVMQDKQATQIPKVVISAQQCVHEGRCDLYSTTANLDSGGTLSYDITSG